jgi:uncharacterized protein
MLMKTLLSLIAPRLAPLVALSMLAPSAPAEEAVAPPDRPFLWQVEGGSLAKPSYLFGTIHLSTPRIERLHPAVERVLKASDELVTEIPLDARTQLAGTALLMRADGGTLSDSIGPKLTQQLGERLKAINPALDAAVFEPMKTWAAAAGVVMLPYQLKGGEALDQILWKKSTEAGRKASGLETMKEQVGAFEVLNEAEQVAYLRETLASWDKNEALTKELVAAYETGDDRAMGELLVKSIRDFGDSEENRKLGEKLLKSVLTDRDLRMAERIDALFRKDPGVVHFIAVGAAHLLGEPGVRKHLEARGYRIRRIVE